MAVAGRVAIVPKGEYSATETYKRLDMVRYEKNTYVARVGNTGAVPYPEDTVTWMMVLENSGGSADKIDYDNTISGLTAVDVQDAIDQLAKITEIAKAPTETELGKAGICYPDGETISIDETGKLTGTPSGKTMTKEEMDARLAAGELKDGDVIYAEGSATGEDGIIIKVDQTVKPDSENAISGKAVYNELEKKANGEGITFSIKNGILYASYDDGTGSDSGTGTDTETNGGE